MIEKTYQFLKTFSEIMVAKGVEEIVLSPGSRNAPLALIIMRNKQLKYHVINDERSAAYFALGRALNTKKMVALTCTSGTAAVNYYPAIVEAYYQKVPLLLLTADRPIELRDQNINQVINQNKLYQEYVATDFSVDLAIVSEDKRKKDFLNINKVLNTGLKARRPVHLNFHLKEPLYSEKALNLKDESLKIIEEKIYESKPSRQDFDLLLDELVTYNKIMVVGGQQAFSKNLRNIFNRLLTLTDVVFVRDITANIHGLERAIMYPDEIVRKAGNDKDLQPDLVITFGNKFTSKKFTEYLNGIKTKTHWHISEDDDYFDMFSSLSKLIKLEAENFFRLWLRFIKKFEHKKFQGFYLKWQKIDEEIQQQLNSKPIQNDELSFVKVILDNLPKNSCLHLGNSLPIRYANKTNLFNNKHAQSIEVFSNRGTSGIDGCLSTAMGAATGDSRKHYIIIGDQSFIYDRNGLWNKNLPDNLIIVVMNNKGGQIFSKIDGPARQPELDEFFISYIPFDFEKEALQFNIYYQQVSSPQKLENALNEAKRLNKLSIIEAVIQTTK
jgi:2-succinyl-5-enolpyruvyl-6-hydroxy-3-cyclohexene-1-carboxylate synthase